MRHKILFSLVIILFLCILVECVYLIFIAPSMKNVPTPTHKIAKEIDKLPTPPKSTSPQEIKNFEKLLLKRAQKTGTIFVSEDCTLSPVVAEMDGTLTVNVVNEDTIPHSLQIEKGQTYTLPANKSTSIKLDSLPKGTLNRLYCDNNPKVSGYVTIPQKMILLPTP